MQWLAQNYGDLREDHEARMRFLKDAKSLLNSVGERLRSEEVIGSRWTVKSVPGQGGYAGKLIGLYPAPRESRGVGIILAHEASALFTRLDGVSGYAQERKLVGQQRLFDIHTRVTDRRPLHSFSPWGIMSLIRHILQEDKK